MFEALRILVKGEGYRTDAITSLGGIFSALEKKDYARLMMGLNDTRDRTLPPARDFPAACFDHIFYRGATLQKAWVAETSAQSSDHRAVLATFALPVAEK